MLPPILNIGNKFAFAICHFCAHPISERIESLPIESHIAGPGEEIQNMHEKGMEKPYTLGDILTPVSYLTFGGGVGWLSEIPN